MKLTEIFDPKYYDELQRQMSTPSHVEEPTNDSSTDMQDFIISSFEADEISYDEALAQLKKVTPKDQWFFWEHELGMADELKKSS